MFNALYSINFNKTSNNGSPHTEFYWLESPSTIKNWKQLQRLPTNSLISFRPHTIQKRKKKPSAPLLLNQQNKLSNSLSLSSMIQTRSVRKTFLSEIGPYDAYK